MKKQKRFLPVLVMALALSLFVGDSGDVQAKNVQDSKIESVCYGKTITDPKNGNDGDDGGSDDGGYSEGGGGGGGSTQISDQISDSEVTDAVNAVTSPGKVDKSKIAAAGEYLSGLTGFLKLLVGFCIVLVSAWIPVTFAADILVAFIPFLDKYIGSGGGSGGAGGPGGNGGKGFHIQLTSRHAIKSGSSGGGPGGPGGSGGKNEWGQYFKDRFVELIYVFLILGLIVSGAYTVLLNMAIKYIMLIFLAIFDVIANILDGILGRG